MSDVTLQLNAASVQSFAGALRNAAIRVEMASKAGMDQSADRFFSRTQSSVPRRTGALASSGRVTNQDLGNYLRRIIGYGSSVANPRTGTATSKYAVQVHEVYNPKSPNSYKWLERTLQSYGREAFLQELAASIRGAL